MIQAVVFDMGNTLLRQDRLLWNRLMKAGLVNQINVFRKRGLRKPTLREWAGSFETLQATLESAAEKDLIEVNVEKIFHYMLAYHEIPSDIAPTMMVSLLFDPIMTARRLFPDVTDTLQRLQDRRCSVAMVSNTMVPPAICRSALDRLNILHFFECTLFSSEWTFRKPHPAMFELAARQLRIKPGRLLYVGDRLIDDVQGAAGAGLRTAWLNRDGKRIKSRVKPDYVIRSLDEISEILQ